MGITPHARIRLGYLVERYEPGGTLDDVVVATNRVALATEQMGSDGVEVTYLGTTYLPEEEAILDAFAAPSIELVRAANERAGTTVARIARAFFVTFQEAPGQERCTCQSDVGPLC